MKKSILTALIAIPMIMLVAFKGGEETKKQAAKPQEASTEFADCIVKYRSKWGEGNCTKCTTGTADTYVVYVKNTCNQKLDVVLAVQEESKLWNRTQWLGIAPNDTIRVYACKGTGKFLKWARKAGDNGYPFPSQQEINEQYK